MEYKNIEVTFYKLVTSAKNPFGYFTKKITFQHRINQAKSMYENRCAAFDEAVRKGHDPRKNIRMRLA